MKEKLKAILRLCYGAIVLLWTLYTGIWFLGVFAEIGFFIYNNLSHIISERSFTILKFSPVLFKDVFSYDWIANVLLWRLTLDVATMYRIAKKLDMHWLEPFFDFRGDFFDRFMSHFFVGIPEAPKSKDDNN